MIGTVLKGDGTEKPFIAGQVILFGNCHTDTGGFCNGQNTDADNAVIRLDTDHHADVIAKAHCLCICTVTKKQICLVNGEDFVDAVGIRFTDSFRQRNDFGCSREQFHDGGIFLCLVICTDDGFRQQIDTGEQKCGQRGNQHELSCNGGNMHKRCFLFIFHCLAHLRISWAWSVDQYTRQGCS